MGFRFYKSIKLAPGVKFNFSKSGISTSLGIPGLMTNFGPRGVRTTVGVPGTGISYMANLGGRSGGGTQNSAKPSTGCGCVILVGVILFLLGLCTSNTEDKMVADNPTRQAFVASDNGANCRSKPQVGAGIVAIFAHGQAVNVAAEDMEWSRIDTAQEQCWIKSELLSDTKLSDANKAEPQISNANEARANTNQKSSINIENAGVVAAAGYAAGRSSNAQSDTGEYDNNHINYGKSEKRKPRSAIRQTKKRRSEGTYGGSCRCSTGRVCVGPRGGRYCMTSGGNKRYGI